jgi:predicted dinucleotide-binding enzyme
MNASQQEFQIVFGTGTLGKAIAQQLIAQGKQVRIDLLQNQKHVRFISFLSELKLSDEIRSQSKSISDRI